MAPVRSGERSPGACDPTGAGVETAIPTSTLTLPSGLPTSARSAGRRRPRPRTGRNAPRKPALGALAVERSLEMTVEQISERQRRSDVEHETAKKIRALLDEAREAYGADAWDENEIESRVLELVTEEE